jgi:hypothetical protein
MPLHQPTYIFLILVHVNCKIRGNFNFGNEMEDLNMKLEITSLCEVNIKTKQKGRY